MDCDGVWREVSVPDETGDLSAAKCSGCGDLLVIVRGRGFDYPAGTDLEAAVRESVAGAIR
jgi:hypothetical protein